MNAHRIISLLAEKNISIYTESGNLKTKAEKGALTSDLVDMIKLNKGAIVKFLQQAQANESRRLGGIPIIERSSEMLPSFAQQRLWFVDKLLGGSTNYNMPMVLKLEGTTDVAAIEQAIQAIVERHEVLRTTYKEADDGVVQVIHDEVVCPFTFIDLSHLKAQDQATEVERLVQADIYQVFDLSQDVMLRACCVALNSEQHVLLINMHHIASDGWSMSVLVKEFMQLYQAFTRGKSNPLPPFQVQYADFAAWQRENLKADVLQQQLEYWKDQLEDVPTVHNLPLDFKREDIPQHRGAMVTGELSAEISAQLAALARSLSMTPFMVVHAVLSLVLSRYSNSTDIVLGTPVANRHQVEVEPLIGFFVNNLVLRSNTEGCETFNEYLEHIKQVNLSAQANQDVPFEQLVEHLNVSRQTKHTPLFQIMLTMNTNEPSNLSLEKLSISPFETEHLSAKFDLLVDAVVSEEKLQFNWLYDRDLFKESTITRLNQHLLTLVEAAVSSPNTKLFELKMLSDAEVNYLFNQLDTAGYDYPKTKSIHQLFSEQASHTPMNEAVRSDEAFLTYQELNQSANRLAHYLLSKGVNRNEYVGIAVNRSVDMIIGMLAILKVGGGYVPLDPAYPDSRLEYMISDCGMKVLLTQSHLHERFASDKLAYVVLDDMAELLQSQPYENPDLMSHATDLAYVNYTSGSTGKPKGIKVPHLGVVRLVSNPNFIELNEKTRFLQAASISFDAATLEIWAPLLNGGCVVLYPEAAMDLSRVNHIVRENEVTDMWLSAGLFDQWSEQVQDMPSLVHVLAGGDVVSPFAVSRVQESLENVTIINGYGPTENTTFTCCYSVPRPNNPGMPLPLGRPINGTQIYVLAQDGTPAPFGCVGELCVGGDGLATGYLNNTDLTQEKFIHNPFAPGFLYKTGDLVRYLENGELVFHGRADNQIKIRGFRIELTEIELALKSIEEVKDAAVVVKEFVEKDKRIVGYVVCKNSRYSPQDMNESAIEERRELIDRLRNHLRQSLPEYMVPAAFFLLEELPLSSTGKVNRKALPDVDLSQVLVTYVAPTIDTEVQLCEIWQQLLDVERVGSADNFFLLGGHSLLVIKLVRQIEERFNVQVAIQVVFDCPDLKSLAAYIELFNTGNTIENQQDNKQETEEIETFQV